MEEDLDSEQLTPPDIMLFESRWLIAIAVSVLVAVLMFDYSTEMVGAPRALLLNVFFLVTAGLLMYFTSRRRSTLARWLLAGPFNLLVVFYDVSHFAAMLDTYGAAYFALIRLAFMAWATYALFTPPARAWFSGEPDPSD